MKTEIELKDQEEDKHQLTTKITTPPKTTKKITIGKEPQKLKGDIDEDEEKYSITELSQKIINLHNFILKETPVNERK